MLIFEVLNFKFKIAERVKIKSVLIFEVPISNIKFQIKNCGECEKLESKSIFEALISNA
jgi:hypothetical protein